MSTDEQSVLAELDSLLEQLQKEDEEEARQADLVVAETPKKLATKSATLKQRKRGRPKITTQMSKKPAEVEKNSVLTIPSKFKAKPPTTSTKKKSGKPAAKKEKGSAAVRPKNPAGVKKDKGDKVNVTKKAGEKAKVTKKVPAKKGDEKFKDQITVVAKKGGEKKRKEKDSSGTTTTKPKDRKSETKQWAKKPNNTYGGGKNQIKVIAVKKTDTTKKKVEVETKSPVKDVQLKPSESAKQKKHKIGKKTELSKNIKKPNTKSTEGKKLTKNVTKVRAKKTAVVKKSEKKIEKTKPDGAKKAEKTKSGSPEKKIDKKNTDLDKDEEKAKTNLTKNTAEKAKKGSKVKDKPKGKKITFKKDKKRPSGTDPPAGETPAKKKRKQKPNKKKPKVKAGVFLESDLTKASDLPIPKRTQACDMSKFEKFENGMVFLCNSRTEKECLDKKLFGSPENQFEAMKSITANTALFLYRVERESPVLHGVFVADGKPALNIDKNVWNGRFPAQVRVKEFYRFPTALPIHVLKKVFKSKRLFQSSSMLSRSETLLFISEINSYSSMGPQHLPVPLHGIRSNFERSSPSHRSTVQQQLEMLNQPINPNPVRMRKWSLTPQMEGDPRMYTHGFQYPQQLFWDGYYGGLQGYNRGQNYHRGGYRGSRWSWHGRGRGRGRGAGNFNPGAVRQEDVEKMLSIEGTKKGGAKKKRNSGRKKKNATKAKPELQPAVQTAKDKDVVKVNDDQKKVKASISDEPAKEVAAIKEE